METQRGMRLYNPLKKNADRFYGYVTEDLTTYINLKRESSCHGNRIGMQATAELPRQAEEVCQGSPQPSDILDKDKPIHGSCRRTVHNNSEVTPNKAGGTGPAFIQTRLFGAVPSEECHKNLGVWIEEQMLENKKQTTDWEATNEAIEEQVAQESYLRRLRDLGKQAPASPESQSHMHFGHSSSLQWPGGVAQLLPTAGALSCRPSWASSALLQALF